MNSKSMHWFFWIVISIILTLQLLTVDDYTFPQGITYSTIITGTFNIYFILLSRYLIRKQIKTKRVVIFVVWVFLLSIATSSILTFEDYALERIFNKDWGSHLKTILPQFFGMWMATILISGVAYAFELNHHHIETLKSTQLLKDTLNELEIKSIRQQLSPHFTFNILNNLQFQIQKDKDKALNLLAQYSQILRYYVYESQNKEIFLDDEISFLKTYLELEKDRLKDEAILIIDLLVAPNALKIAPFILSTFVENAFKHLSLKNKWVSVKIFTVKHELSLEIQNTYDAGIDVDRHNAGVGLEMARKRLELMYPGKYKLNIQREKGIFSVGLNLNFAQDEN